MQNRNRPELTRAEIIRLLAPIAVPEKPTAVYGVFRLCGLNLDGVDFSGLNLSGVDFSNASLRGCRFAHAIIEGCAFFDADLSQADFRDARLAVAQQGAECAFNSANLTGANFQKVNASGNSFENADFSGADLREANFDACKLRDAKFAQAKIGATSLVDADFEFYAFDRAIFPEDCETNLILDEDRSEQWCKWLTAKLERESQPRKRQTKVAV